MTIIGKPPRIPFRTTNNENDNNYNNEHDEHNTDDGTLSSTNNLNCLHTLLGSYVYSTSLIGIIPEHVNNHHYANNQMFTTSQQPNNHINIPTTIATINATSSINLSSPSTSSSSSITTASPQITTITTTTTIKTKDTDGNINENITQRQVTSIDSLKRFCRYPSNAEYQRLPWHLKQNWIRQFIAKKKLEYEKSPPALWSKDSPTIQPIEQFNGLEKVSNVHEKSNIISVNHKGNNEKNIIQINNNQNKNENKNGILVEEENKENISLIQTSISVLEPSFAPPISSSSRPLSTFNMITSSTTTLTTVISTTNSSNYSYSANSDFSSMKYSTSTTKMSECHPRSISSSTTSTSSSLLNQRPIQIRNINPPMDIVHSFFHRNFQNIQQYMQSFLLQLPIPMKCFVKEYKTLGGRRRYLELVFVCEGSISGGKCRDTCPFVKKQFQLRTTNIQFWLHIMALGRQFFSDKIVDKNDVSLANLQRCWVCLNNGNLSPKQTTSVERKRSFRMSKTNKFKNFDVILTSVFPDESKWMKAVDELKSVGYYSYFQPMETVNRKGVKRMKWICNVCRIPQFDLTQLPITTLVLEKRQTSDKWLSVWYRLYPSAIHRFTQEFQELESIKLNKINNFSIQPVPFNNNSHNSKLSVAPSSMAVLTTSFNNDKSKQNNNSNTENFPSQLSNEKIDDGFSQLSINNQMDNHLKINNNQQQNQPAQYLSTIDQHKSMVLFPETTPELQRQSNVNGNSATDSLQFMQSRANDITNIGKLAIRKSFNFGDTKNKMKTKQLSQSLWYDDKQTSYKDMSLRSSFRRLDTSHLMKSLRRSKLRLKIRPRAKSMQQIQKNSSNLIISQNDHQLRIKFKNSSKILIRMDSYEQLEKWQMYLKALYLLEVCKDEKKSDLSSAEDQNHQISTSKPSINPKKIKRESNSEKQSNSSRHLEELNVNNKNECKNVSNFHDINQFISSV